MREGGAGGASHSRCLPVAPHAPPLLTQRCQEHHCEVAVLLAAAHPGTGSSTEACVRAHRQAVGAGGTAWEGAGTRRVGCARVGLSPRWRFTLKKGKRSCLYFMLTFITPENKVGVRARNKSLLKIHWVNALIFHGAWMRAGE